MINRFIFFCARVYRAWKPRLCLGGHFVFVSYFLFSALSLVFCGLFVCASVIEAAAPPVVSLLVSAERPLLNEFGQPLRGTDPDATHFGIPAETGDRVAVYVAKTGVVFPPAVDGTPDPLNELIFSTRIGMGAPAYDARPGIFSVPISPRPPGGSIIFVRVFNAPDPDDASFYKDSQLFTVSWAANENFTAVFADGPQPLDDADDDGDGLHNSWERSYGTDPNRADTDGDGLTDWEEVIAGTDPTDGHSIVAISDVSVIDGVLRLGWWSVLGRAYDVQVLRGALDDDDGVFETISTHSGVNEHLWIQLPGLRHEELSTLRIRVRMLVAE